MIKLWILALTLVHSSVFAAEPKPGSQYAENSAFKKISQKSKWSPMLLLTGNPIGTGSKGLGLRVNYSIGMASVDLGVQYSQVSWGSLVSSPSPNDAISLSPGDAIDSPTSEINRARASSDSWTLLAIELGYTIRGRLFPMEAKKWVQYGRFSLARATLNDQANQIPFAGTLFGVEAGLEYLLTDSLLLVPHLTYRFGSANRSDQGATNQNHISISQFQMGLGLLLSF